MSWRAAAAAVAVVAVVGGSAAWWLSGQRAHVQAAPRVPGGTAAVVRTSLATTTQLSGTVTYPGAATVVAQLSGTITRLPDPGHVVRPGQRLYEVDGVPVFLFRGDRPAWRSFTPWMTSGADVRQLQRNLRALGFRAVEVTGIFDWPTDEAVWRWQEDTHQPATGTIDLGRILFAPSSVRVVADDVPLGAYVQPGQAVLATTSIRPVVSVPVPLTQAYLVHRGDRVTVTLPSGRTVPGRVSRVSPVAGSGPSGNQSAAAPPEPSLPAEVSLDRPAAAASLDQAPVTVNVVDQRVRNVLAVPVTALVALASGGYGVWVDTGTSRHLVPVRPGLFANTLVQVTAPRLRAGDRVEVPTS